MYGFSDWQNLNPSTEMRSFSDSVYMGEDPYADDEYKQQYRQPSKSYTDRSHDD